MTQVPKVATHEHEKTAETDDEDQVNDVGRRKDKTKSKAVEED